MEREEIWKNEHSEADKKIVYVTWFLHFAYPKKTAQHNFASIYDPKYIQSIDILLGNCSNNNCTNVFATNRMPKQPKRNFLVIPGNTWPYNVCKI